MLKTIINNLVTALKKRSHYSPNKHITGVVKVSGTAQELTRGPKGNGTETRGSRMGSGIS